MSDVTPTRAVIDPGSPAAATSGSVRGDLVHKREAAPVSLLAVTAALGQRTRATGVLWNGVLNATPDDDTDGPSPIESLLAALAGCLARNLRSTADSAHPINGVAADLDVATLLAEPTKEGR